MLLPEYLSSQDKERLSWALSQFFASEKSGIDYSKFFDRQKKEAGWFQGDIVRKLRLPRYDSDKKEYIKEYHDCLILSNSCDISSQNIRSIPKQVVVAPLVSFDEFSEKIKSDFSKEKNANLLREITNQKSSNLFYIPVTSNNSAYIAYLDNLSWFPVNELNSENYLNNQRKILIERLSLFGLYILLVKLSYHFCRTPEDNQRAF